ncbi:MAG: cytochrome-c peroxidase [Planctomycetota bacterium]
MKASTIRPLCTTSAIGLFLFLIAAPGFTQPPPPLGPLPPPLVPPQNPITAAKAVLGKILFWDEQLSSDDTIACGSCHIPGVAGQDPRTSSAHSVHPGADAIFGTADDVAGSIGVVSQELDGAWLDDGTFYPERQVTRRSSQSVVAAAYSPLQFWDGRSGPSFVDPETGTVVIPIGGGLEAQALGPILSSVEMGAEGRTWDAVRIKLENVTPLAYATDIPSDMAAAIAAAPTYPQLFAAAFGTTQISARRIAFAIATYERTLVPNQSPFDSFLAGIPGSLTPAQNQGRQVLVNNCVPCHGGQLATDQQFHNVGLRPSSEDLGRMEVTGDPNDAGRFKTPTLRNVKLSAPYFHNGGKATLQEVLDFYNAGGDFEDDQSPLIEPMGLSALQLTQLRDFLENALTDPRVENELPPFDRPTLRPTFRRGDSNADDAFDLADALHVLAFIFNDGAAPACLDAADANDDSGINIADAITMLTRLFGSAPPLPAPTDYSHGPDPTTDALGCGN